MARQENASYEGQRQRSSKQVTALDIYPVGAIFLTMDARNPAEYFGGKWELLAPGRTLVCVDTSQDEFNAPEKPVVLMVIIIHMHTLRGTMC